MNKNNNNSIFEESIAKKIVGAIKGKEGELVKLQKLLKSNLHLRFMI